MNSIAGLPSTEGLHALLDRFAGAAAYIVPMTNSSGRALGNNGDTLMHRVFDRLLTELSISREWNPDSADILIVPPSGALVEAYAFPDLLADRIRGYESIPLVIFPSSAYFPTVDPSSIFRQRSAETLLILREARSMSHLVNQWGSELENEGVELALDHDVVASGHAYVPDIIDLPIRAKRLLIAARRDRERSASALDISSNAPQSTGLRDAVMSVVPYGGIKTAIARRGRAGINNSVARALVESLPPEISAEVQAMDARPLLVDISANQFATFAEYRRAIANASMVVTNRLHVALPSAILGTRVVLVEAGYFKLQGVYDRSLSDLQHVTLINPSVVEV
jgi:exopolysaccharide biosynthesis predicted pyruvyltransferase EpsI